MKWTGQCLGTVLLGLVSFSTLSEELKLKQIASGYQIPWGMEFIDSANAVITEKNGRISLLDVTQGQKTPLYQVTNVDDSGQGGLLDVALSPITRQQLYFIFSKEVDTGTTVVLATARLQNKELSDWQELFVADAVSTTGRHFGSRIAFDDNNHLYVSIGDRGVRDNGQDPSNHAATILRLTLDGKIPDDNPFMDNSEVKKEIWSFGHRNPQGLFFDGKTQRLWSVEHGPRGAMRSISSKQAKIMAGRKLPMAKNIGVRFALEKPIRCPASKRPNGSIYLLLRLVASCSIAVSVTRASTASC